LIFSFKNLFIGIILFSLISGQDFKDIDIKLTNLEFDKAQELLEQLYNKYPQNTNVLLRLSITHHYLSEKAIQQKEDKENSQKAFKYIDRAFSLNSKDPNVLKWYVIALGKTVEQESIREQIEQSKNIEELSLKVIELLPDDEFCYNIMGQWHYKLASLGKASRRIASFLFSEPPHGSFEQARFYLEKSLEINPDYISTYYWLGKTHLKLGNEEKAYDLFNKGILLDRPFKREEKLFQDMNNILRKNN
jgi:tetratricopeptide (TPR) repeat protein